MIDYFYLVVPFRLNHLNHRILDVLYPQELALNPNLVPILHPAHIETLKVADSFKKAHPERTVVILDIFALGKSRTYLWVIHKFNLNALVPI